QAPKGGTVRQAAFGTYDNFNMVVAGWKGKLAAGVSRVVVYERVENYWGKNLNVRINTTRPGRRAPNVVATDAPRRTKDWVPTMAINHPPVRMSAPSAVLRKISTPKLK